MGCLVACLKRPPDHYAGIQFTSQSVSFDQSYNDDCAEE
jgi:hypothetical protein